MSKRNTKKTYEEFLNDLETTNPDYECPKIIYKHYKYNYYSKIKTEEYNIKIEQEYKTNKSDLIFFHKKCGFDFPAKPVNITRKEVNCPMCDPKCSRKKDNRVIDKLIREKTNNEYYLDEDSNYIGKDKPIKIHHSLCDLSYTYNEYENFMGTEKRNGRRCPYCNKWVLKLTDEYVVNSLKYNNILDFFDIKTYSIENNTIILTHKACGHDTEELNLRLTITTKSENANNICRWCSFGKKNRTVEMFKNLYKIRFDNNCKFEILEDDAKLFTNFELMNVKCIKCGEIIKLNQDQLLRGINCTSDSCKSLNGSSYLEKELFDYIKSLNSNLDIKENDRTILNGKELDILVKNKNIAFEFDGLYWHSDLYKSDKNYHLKKTNDCALQNIRLIHIYEDEWKLKNKITKSKIKNILGLNNNEKIYARRCYIKEIKSSKEKNDFLEKNHIQGKDTALIKLGLYTKNENKLVSVMTFSKISNQGEDFDYELSRFASDIDYHVIGAFSKLFKYFSINYNWNKIITYADKRWSNGNVYIKNGWTYIRDSNPSYDYIDQYYSYRINRLSMTKKKIKEKYPEIFDDNKTEKEMTEELGLSRIWNCGNMVFEYIKK